jgi:hypothetical protein
MLGADTFDAGVFEIPFEFIIEPIPGEKLVESYHGVYVNVQYTVSVELKRSGMFARPLTADVELLVHTPVSFAFAAFIRWAFASCGVRDAARSQPAHICP